MNEFDMVTKVKMIFALSAPIDEELLVELKKVADVDVDDQQRVTRYKQRDGRLELSGVKKENQRNRELIQLLAEMSKKTSKPIAVKPFLREFKANTGCPDSIVALEHRYQRLRETIYQSTEVDKNTKIKMMFISNAKLSEEIIKELRKDADVEVDGVGRITKYKSKDGSLELEGNHGMSSIKKAVHSDRWEIIYQIANINESEEDDGEETDCQKDYERKRIDLVRFLIKRTKSATSPLSITQLAKNYQAEFKSSEPLRSIESWIQRLRQRIYETNQFDTATKVKMLFSLSASVDTKLLKELRKDAIVELDETQKIKKYKSNDGSLELERNYSRQTKVKAASAKRTRIVSNSSESTGEKDAQSTRSSQSSARIQKRRKRGRVAYSSSEDSEENDDDEESLKQKDDWSMDFDANNADDFDYDPSNYELVMDHIPIEEALKCLIDVKAEEPNVQSSINEGGYNEENFFEYDLLNDVDDMEHIPEEKKAGNSD